MISVRRTFDSSVSDEQKPQMVTDILRYTKNKTDNKSRCNPIKMYETKGGTY